MEGRGEMSGWEQPDLRTRSDRPAREGRRAERPSVCLCTQGTNCLGRRVGSKRVKGIASDPTGIQRSEG